MSAKIPFFLGIKFHHQQSLPLALFISGYLLLLLETFNLYLFNLHEFNFEWKEDSDTDCLKQHS